MELNRLERTFFDRILCADLDVPVRATVEYEGHSFDCIVVPKIDGRGYFTLEYYNASDVDSATRMTESGSDSQTRTLLEAFGLDPLLERAWIQSDLVSLHLNPAPVPFRPGRSRKLEAAVRYASTGNRGGLGLYENQVLVQKAPLKRTEFSLVGFPDFQSSDGQMGPHALIEWSGYEELKKISAKLGDKYKIKIESSPNHVELQSADGWSIRLSRDKDTTRHQVSHTGLIQKVDETEYGIEDLQDVLQALECFLAFAAGAYCYPTAVIGFDSRDRPALGKIGRLDAPTTSVPNWFNRGSLCFDAALQDLFPGFWRRWRKNRNEVIAVIQCYLHSNVMRESGLPQEAAAKSYTGLETLASVILGKTITRDSHEEIEGVLQSKQIPHLDLNSSETPVMAKLCGDLALSDSSGSHLLGNVRNYVSHPLDPKTSAEVKQKHLRHLESDRSYYAYLHDLSQFYLEYTLLKFCDYGTSKYRELLEQTHRVSS